MHVCLTVAANTPKRMGMALSTIASWRELDVPLTIFDVSNTGWYDEFGVIPKPREGSQRHRHLWAEEHATTPIYAVADDDALLLPTVLGYPGHTWISYVQDVMDRCELVSCQPWLLPDHERPPQDDLYWGDQEVRKDRAVGAIRFQRQGIIRDDLPPQDGPSYDSLRNRYLNAYGRLGILTRVRAHHLGWRCSTLR